MVLYSATFVFCSYVYDVVGWGWSLTSATGKNISRQDCIFPDCTFRRSWLQEM